MPAEGDPAAGAVATAEHPMVVRGRDGWLFLKNDSNDGLAQVTGRYPLPPEFEATWRTLFEHRAARVGALGAAYAFQVAPDKYLVCDRFVPPEIRLADRRPVHAVLAAAAAVSPVRALYPLEALRVAAADTFMKGDSHWTHHGARIAADQLLAALGLPRIEADEFEIVARSGPGDLSGKIGETTEITLLRPRAPRHRLVERSPIVGGGRVQIYEHDDRTLPRAVVFHDSFGTAEIEFLAARFSRLVSAWMPNIDAAVLEREAPDVVVNLQAERFLVVPPDDARDPTLAARIRYKAALGGPGTLPGDAILALAGLPPTAEPGELPDPAPESFGLPVVHADDDVLVLFDPAAVAAATSVVVSFTGIGHGSGGIDVQGVEFAGTVARHGSAIVVVVDRRRSWGNAIDPELMRRTLTPHLAGKTVYTVGNSMGGFLAILFAELLGAASALAFAPQFSVSDKVLPDEPRWRRYRNRITEFRVESLADAFVPASTAFYTINGAGEHERLHWARFPTGPHIRHFVLAGHGHDVAISLKKAGLLPAIVAGAFARTLGEADFGQLEVFSA